MAPPDDPMVYTPHLDSAYEREINSVSSSVARMADHAERMVRDAVLALLARDEALAEQVLAADETLDQMETQIDKVCVELLARRSPVGRDLRLVTATLKLVADLERIGDLAGNVVKRGLGFPAGFELPAEVADLARCVVEELSLTLDALRKRDSDQARRIRAEDRSTDDRNRAAFDRLIRLGHEQPQHFEAILALTSICRHLERIGDHAVNVAEMIVYMVDGKVLRHRADV